MKQSDPKNQDYETNLPPLQNLKSRTDSANNQTSESQNTPDPGQLPAKSRAQMNAKQIELAAKQSLDKKHQEEMEQLRIIDLDQRPLTQLRNKVRSNIVRTHKYQWYTFLPLNLFEQFKKASNCYFFTIMCMQMVDVISISNGQPAMLYPLVFVIVLSMIKDAYEDYMRYRDDAKENNDSCLVFDPQVNQFQNAKWSEIKVGNIVRVLENGFFPADLVLLQTANEDENICYVETKNLDGETNLKTKTVPKDFAAALTSNSDLSNFKGQFTCEKPNNRIYKFDGTYENQPTSSKAKQDGRAVAVEHQQQPKMSLLTQIEATEEQNRKMRISLSAENVALRGMSLKNTPSVTGLVVYTGHDTKIQMNSAGAIYKTSNIMRGTNRQIIIIFLVQIILASIGSCIGTTWMIRNIDNSYLNFDKRDQWNTNWFLLFVKTTGTWILIFTSFVPISLLVTLEIVKFFQGFFMQWDVLMYDGDQDFPMKAQSTNINEELGQVHYIFSDKTGTLTCNIMEFRKFSAATGSFNVYADGSQEIGMAGQIQSSQPADLNSNRNSETAVKSNQIHEQVAASDLNNHFDQMIKSSGNQAQLLQVKQGGNTGHELQQQDDGFQGGRSSSKVTANGLLISAKRRISLRNDVSMRSSMLSARASQKGSQRSGENSPVQTFGLDLVDQKVFYSQAQVQESLQEAQGSQYEDISQILTHLALCHSVVIDQRKGVYNSSSPDELALVQGAKKHGFEFLGKDPNGVLKISTPGGRKPLQYKLLNTLEFTSARKRMSVVLEDLQTNKLVLLTKGADSVIEKLLDLDSVDKQAFFDQTQSYIDVYAADGLRTLCLTRKELSREVYEQWNGEFQDALNSVFNRDEKIEEISAKIEQGLTLIGSTAIEDKLQEEVTETIVSMKSVGIKVWVLTGDKIETAINIGYSCGLLNNEMSQFVIDSKQSGKVGLQLAEIAEVYENRQPDLQGETKALIIAGDSLLMIEQSQTLSNLFLKVTDLMDVVVACRVSPKQKGNIVQMVRQRHPDKITLAIGDGANDCAMINQAHVGIGIAGREGMQAARASDFAIGKFKFLKPLLFIHGREAYRRNADLVVYNFYKNVLYVIVQFNFGFYSVFSGQTLYEPFIYQMYNMFFTGVAPMWWALFDFEHCKETFLANPRLYRIGMDHTKFSMKIFWTWIAFATYQTVLLLFFCIVFIQMNPEVPQGGLVYNFWASGHMTYLACVVLANFCLLQMTNNVTGVGETLIFLQIASFFVFFYGENLVFTYSVLFRIWEEFVSSPASWLGCLLAITTPFTIDAIYRKSISSLGLFQGNGKRSKLIKTIRSDRKVEPDDLQKTGLIQVKQLGDSQKNRIEMHNEIVLEGPPLPAGQSQKINAAESSFGNMASRSTGPNSQKRSRNQTTSGMTPDEQAKSLTQEMQPKPKSALSIPQQQQIENRENHEYKSDQELEFPEGGMILNEKLRINESGLTDQSHLGKQADREINPRLMTLEDGGDAQGNSNQDGTLRVRGMQEQDKPQPKENINDQTPSNGV